MLSETRIHWNRIHDCHPGEHHALRAWYSKVCRSHQRTMKTQGGESGSTSHLNTVCMCGGEWTVHSVRMNFKHSTSPRNSDSLESHSQSSSWRAPHWHFTYCRTLNYWIAVGKNTSVYRGTWGYGRSAGGPNKSLKERSRFCTWNLLSIPVCWSDRTCKFQNKDSNCGDSILAKADN